MTSRRIQIALGAMFGLQALRAFLPLLVYVLKDRCELPSTSLGALALLLFATAFGMPALVRRAGPRALARSALTLAIVRGALQVWKGDPAVSLALAAAATAAFVAFLASLSRGAPDRPGPVPAVLLGALLDAALHALFGTRDLHWGGAASDAVVLLLVAASVLLAVRAGSLEPSGDVGDLPGGPTALGLVAWGPFLYLHLEVLGNVARLSARTGLATGPAGAIVALGLAGGIVLAGGLAPDGARRRPVAIAPALALLAGGVLSHGVTGPAAIPLLLAAQLGGAAILARAATRFASPPRPGPEGAAFGGGFVLFLLLIFAHYAGYDLDLPFSRTVLFAAGALALAVAAVAGRTGSPGAAFRTEAGAAPAPRLGVLLLVAILLPLARPVLAPRQPPPVRTTPPDAIRVVTFNLHAGFDERGGWGLDRMLAHLRGTEPDVVALQEVSRGWVINGSADLYELARESLALPAVPGPSVSYDWGNAVFARRTPVAARTLPAPPDSLPIPRAVTEVELDLGSDGRGTLRVLGTHLHHREADAGIRNVQARFLAARAGEIRSEDAAILLGDFNAQPDSECLAILARAGWRDVFREAEGAGRPGAGPPGATFPARAPVRRIDTILYRGPLRLARTEVAPPWGSDHRAVIAELVRTRP